MTATLSQSFGKAFCQHFNLPPNQVAQEITLNNKPNDIFGATLQIYLTGEDLIEIGRIMKETTK